MEEDTEGGTHYDTLGVDPMTSTLKDFKKAYRQKALLYHPDRVPLEEKEESTAKFREVREAFEVLSSVRQKIRYDHLLGIDEERAEARRKGHREREETKTEENDDVESNRKNSNHDENDPTTTPSDFNKNTFAKKKKKAHKWKANTAPNFEGTTPSEFNKNTFAKKKKTQWKTNKNANAAPDFQGTTPTDWTDTHADREKVLNPKVCLVFPRNMTLADAAKIGVIIVAVVGFTCLIIYT